MANDPISKTVLDEMYNFMMASISAGTAVLDGKVGTTVSVKMGVIDVVKDIFVHPGENSYQVAGRITGDVLGVVGSIWVGGKIKGLTTSVKLNAAGAFATSEAVAHIQPGDTFANLFNTYIANADAFYTKILTDENYANEIWNGLTASGLDDYMNFYNRNPSEVASDLVAGFKELFSAPPAYGTAEFELQYNTQTNQLSMNSSDESALAGGVLAVEKSNQFNQLTINSQTYDITQCDNLLVRNAIFDIPKVSFLLSHIDIHSGDVLDLGDKGLYKVVSGDTMSEIAEANGMTTQQLLSYNTWLIDDKKVTFDQDKVLVANLEPSDFTDKDHNLLGCELEDRLIDHNDGDDTLLGMGGDDYLDGGKGSDQLVGGTGFDTYISDNGDKIFDEDGEGEVYFDETLLTGGKKEAGSGCEPTEEDGSSVYKGNGGTYTLSGDTLTFEKGGETLTILNLSDKRMVA